MISLPPGRPASRGLLAIAAASAALTLACVFAVDRPIARLVGDYEPLSVWNRGLDVLDWLSGLWLLGPLSPWPFIGLLVAVLVPRWRPRAPAWMFVAGVHLAARFPMLYGKQWMGRIRPPVWLKKGGDTFFRGGDSFPSGHVTLYASLALPLALLFPRARVPLLAVTVFVACARVGVNGHFVGDTIGAFTMVVVATWAIAWLVRPFQR